MIQIIFLVDQAHSLFGKVSVFNVVALPTRRDVINKILEAYGLVDKGTLDQYLSILDQLRKELAGEVLVRLKK